MDSEAPRICNYYLLPTFKSMTNRYTIYYRQCVRISVSIVFGSANGYMLAGSGRREVVYVVSALWWDGAHSTAHMHEPLACPDVLCQANIQLYLNSMLLQLSFDHYTSFVCLCP